MGYMTLWGRCFVCKGMFSSNPTLVPSYDNTSWHLRLCRTCLDNVNEKRVENNLQPFVARAGAYEPQEVD